MAAGIREGDCVVTVPNTFIATTEAISQAGAVPEFVDIDERTYNMSPASLRKFLETQCDPDRRTGLRISRRTGRPVAAVVPVHLYGQMADMDAILDIAEEYNLIVVEDACQAHGAQYFSRRENAWKKAGSMGIAAAFSFYPGKNLGACGEAGAVTTNDEEIAHAIRMIRDHGQAKKYYHDIEGYNGRLDALQAGLLRVKLQHLADGTSSGESVRPSTVGYSLRSLKSSLSPPSPRGLKASITSTWSAMRTVRDCRLIWVPKELELASTIRFRCTCRRRIEASDTGREISL